MSAHLSRRTAGIGPGRGGQRGGAAVIALAFIAGLSLLGSSVFAVSLRNTRVASNAHNHAQALYFAEAATNEARMRLSPTASADVHISLPLPLRANWRAYIGAGYPIATAGDACNATLLAKLDAGFSAGNDNHCYTSAQSAMAWGLVRIQTRFTTNDGDLVPVLVQGRPVHTLTAWGTSGNERRQVTLDLLPMQLDTIPDVIHAVGMISLENDACIDSYNSNLTPYAYGGPGNCDPAGTATVTTGTRTLRLRNRARIYGDVLVAGTSLPATVAIEGNGAGISGSVTTAPAQADWPLPPIPDGLSCLTDLRLDGSAVRTLAEGAYCFRKVRISDQAQVVTTGTVKMFVTDTMSIAGQGFVTHGNRPANLTIYATGRNVEEEAEEERQGITLAGQSATYAAIYAPRSDIRVIGNADFFGALVGRNVELRGNGAIHYDEAMGTIGGSPIGFRRTNWREILGS